MTIPIDWRNKAISAFRNRLQKTGILWIILQDSSNPAYSEVQPVLEVHICVSPPHLVSQFLAGNDLSGSGGKNREDLSGLGLELYGRAITPEFPRSAVQFVVAEGEPLVRLLVCCHGWTPRLEVGTWGEGATLYLGTVFPS